MAVWALWVNRLCGRCGVWAVVAGLCSLAGFSSMQEAGVGAPQRTCAGTGSV